MTAEEIIQQILSKHPEVSRDQILETLEAEKIKTGCLVADKTLLRLIAARYGVEICQNKICRKISISHLVPGLNDVTVTGRVIAVFPTRTFKGEKSGKFANLMIADKDAVLRVLLWNDKVDLIESGEIKVGQIIRFSHGYTREDREGKTEMHLSTRSQIEVEPKNEKADSYPCFDRCVTRIAEITQAQKDINLAGTVKEVFPMATFTRKDQSKGTVMRFILADETGEIRVVVWNKKAEELEKSLKINAQVQLVNAKVKEKASGELEVHVNSKTYVEASERLDS
jgi:ssDNA-binding replication factor A large subunit